MEKTSWLVKYHGSIWLGDEGPGQAPAEVLEAKVPCEQELDMDKLILRTGLMRYQGKVFLYREVHNERFTANGSPRERKERLYTSDIV